MAVSKVVFVTPHWGKPRTGPEVYARYLWDAFRDDPDIEFHIVTSGSENSHPKLHLVNTRGGSLGLFRDVSSFTMKLIDELGGPGVLHVNNSNFHGSLLSSPWSIIGQVNDYETAQFYPQFFQTLYRQGPRRLLSLWRRRILEAQFVRRQEVTLCNSEYTRKQIIHAYGVTELSRVRVVYKAVDTTSFVRPPVVSQTVGHPPSVLFAGSDFRRKGLNVLIEALVLSPRPLALRVAGVAECDFESAFPGRIAKARAQGSSIEFLGPVERSRMPSLLWKSDIFCLPSRSEALGVALLEALAAGLPCVATSVGGIPEIAHVVPGVTLVAPDSPVELAKAIESALISKNIDDRSVALREYFGRDTMVKKIRELYLELAS